MKTLAEINKNYNELNKQKDLIIAEMCRLEGEARIVQSLEVKPIEDVLEDKKE